MKVQLLDLMEETLRLLTALLQRLQRCLILLLHSTLTTKSSMSA